MFRKDVAHDNVESHKKPQFHPVVRRCNNSAKELFQIKIFKDKAYEIAINPKYDGCQRGLSSMVYKVFDKEKHQEQQTWNIKFK